MSAAPLLDIRGLAVEFVTRRGPLRALDDVSFSIARGEILGLVGESGAGKSLTGRAIIGLIDPPGRICGGEIAFEGRRIDDLGPEEIRKLRGRRIGTIFQDPLTSLDPLQRIGDQLVETIRTHLPLSESAARERAISLLTEVGLPAAAERMRAWPHEFSGGMRQRVVIALALACEPSLLIADEPTTALDVTVQAQILDLLRDLQAQTGMAIILITHDLGVVAEMADEVVVMYGGRIAEQGPVEVIFSQPSHPYTRGLLASIPRLSTPHKSRLPTIEGTVPSLDAMPSGCRFQNRCPFAEARCGAARPPLESVGTDHVVSCARWRELPAYHEGVSALARPRRSLRWST